LTTRVGSSGAVDDPRKNRAPSAPLWPRTQRTPRAAGWTGVRRPQL